MCACGWVCVPASGRAAAGLHFFERRRGRGALLLRPSPLPVQSSDSVKAGETPRQSTRAIETHQRGGETKKKVRDNARGDAIGHLRRDVAKRGTHAREERERGVGASGTCRVARLLSSNTAAVARACGVGARAPKDEGATSGASADEEPKRKKRRRCTRLVDNCFHAALLALVVTAPRTVTSVLLYTRAAPLDALPRFPQPAALPPPLLSRACPAPCHTHKPSPSATYLEAQAQAQAQAHTHKHIHNG